MRQSSACTAGNAASLPRWRCRQLLGSLDLVPLSRREALELLVHERRVSRRVEDMAVHGDVGLVLQGHLQGAGGHRGAQAEGGVPVHAADEHQPQRAVPNPPDERAAQHHASSVVRSVCRLLRHLGDAGDQAALRVRVGAKQLEDDGAQGEHVGAPGIRGRRGRRVPLPVAVVLLHLRGDLRDDLRGGVAEVVRAPPDSGGPPRPGRASLRLPRLLAGGPRQDAGREQSADLGRHARGVAQEDPLDAEAPVHHAPAMQVLQGQGDVQRDVQAAAASARLELRMPSDPELHEQRHKRRLGHDQQPAPIEGHPVVLDQIRMAQRGLQL
mmetsp:Transcript_26336/g.73953  ORF Transcript_26336/g.73953 Transcript_26336/m.73953 type:complete len:326 (-) Transcript_26336:400-1377(-)